MNQTADGSDTLNNYIAGGIILVIATSSLLVTSLTTICMLRVKNLRNSFGFLCVSQGIADCGVLLIFAVWCAPVTFSQNMISTEVFGKKVGQLSLFFWFGYIYSTLLIGVNRFVAISFPVRYRRLFADRNTIRFIIGCWILATFHTIFYFFDGCDFYYDPTTYVWYFASTSCGNFISFYLDFCFGIGCFIIIFTFNVLTAVKLHLANSQLTNQTASQTTSEIRDQERRRKREIRFFIQACINGASFNFMLISFHVFSRYAWDTWSLFATTSLIWQVSHASNGFVFLAFNSDLRRLVLSPKHVCQNCQTQEGMNNTTVIHKISQVDKNSTATTVPIASKKSTTSMRTMPINNFVA